MKFHDRVATNTEFVVYRETLLKNSDGTGHRVVHNESWASSVSNTPRRGTISYSVSRGLAEDIDRLDAWTRLGLGLATHFER